VRGLGCAFHLFVHRTVRGQAWLATRPGPRAAASRARAARVSWDQRTSLRRLSLLIPANIRERPVNTEANTDRLNRRRARIYVAGCHEISAAKRNFVAARHEIPGRGGGLSLPYLSPYSLIAHVGDP
jgi:hypothetical protein